jgi:hypothetical protein
MTYYENHFATLEDQDGNVLESAIGEAMQRLPKLVPPEASIEDESQDLESTTAKRSKRGHLMPGQNEIVEIILVPDQMCR